MRVALIVACFLVAACHSTYFGDALPVPAGCEQMHLDAARCAAAVEGAATDLGLSAANVAAVDLLTEDRCGDDRAILCSRSSAIAYPIRFTLRDGRVVWTAVFCIVDVPRPWC